MSKETILLRRRNADSFAVPDCDMVFFDAPVSEISADSPASPASESFPLYRD